MADSDSPLRVWRKGKRKTVSDLAVDLKTTESNLSRIETGFHRAGLDLQDRIVDATGLTRDQIVEPWLRRQAKQREAPPEPEEGEQALVAAQ